MKKIIMVLGCLAYLSSISAEGGGFERIESPADDGGERTPDNGGQHRDPFEQSSSRPTRRRTTQRPHKTAFKPSEDPTNASGDSPFGQIAGEEPVDKGDVVARERAAENTRPRGFFEKVRSAIGLKPKDTLEQLDSKIKQVREGLSIYKSRADAKIGENTLAVIKEDKDPKTFKIQYDQTLNQVDPALLRQIKAGEKLLNSLVKERNSEDIELVRKRIKDSKKPFLLQRGFSEEAADQFLLRQEFDAQKRKVDANANKKSAKKRDVARAKAQKKGTRIREQSSFTKDTAKQWSGQ